ncbi:spermatogenesis-associated protein 33 [Otolemur garnettii]|uniref:spermatogenesis-associated protein 33 n=1 Tax=Otolemur garnettii TaxID=30611 RepID=UPI0002742694|nr:spermatogenesis-associated protein 33 [Otolemur garnettii]
MGLCKSKHKLKKGEEQKKAPTSSAPKSKEKHPQESRQSDKELEKLSDPPAGADEEKADGKQKSNKKKNVIPRIIITRASNETLVSDSSSVSEEQRTIREQHDWGPYYRHRNPSTVDAYNLHTTE